MSNTAEPDKKGKKKWLVALLAGALAAVEVITPHVGPIVRVLLEVRHAVGQATKVPVRLAEPSPKNSVS